MPGKYKFPRGTPKPKCLTCSKPVRAHVNKYCSIACIPKAVYQAAGAKGNAIYAYRARRQKFEAVFADMVRNGQTLTKEAILDAFQVIDRQAYHRCYQVWWRKSKAERKRSAA